MSGGDVDDDTPQVPDGPDWRSDGTVVLYVDGEEWNSLRRAKFGELRQLRESLQEISDESLRLTAKEVIARPARPEPNADAEAKLNYTLAMREGQRRLNDAIESLFGDWVRQAFDLLGGSELPDDTEWPPWLVDGSFPPALITHLRSVPLARGAS